MLDDIAATPFFRTFKANMAEECPFWAQQRMCNRDKLSVYGLHLHCEEEDVPAYWRK